MMKRDWRWDDLNPREQEIVRLICLGNEKHESIAADLGISRTRIFQVTNVIYRIMGVENNVQLALLVGQHYNEVFKTEEIRIA